MPFSFLPRMIYPHLTDVRAEDLTARGISFLMLDFDNTIVPYTTSNPTLEMAAWLKELKGMPGLSGNLGFDAKGDRVGEFYRTYKVDATGNFVLQPK